MCAITAPFNSSKSVGGGIGGGIGAGACSCALLALLLLLLEAFFLLSFSSLDIFSSTRRFRESLLVFDVDDKWLLTDGSDPRPDLASILVLRSTLSCPDNLSPREWLLLDRPSILDLEAFLRARRSAVDSSVTA